MSTLIIFEYPLNERIRTFLRIEHLYERLEYFLPQYDPWATRVAVETLLEIAAITARADVKSELLKELDRHLGILNRISHQPGIDPDALEVVLGNLEEAVDGVQHLTGTIGQYVRDDEFLKSLAQRSNVPGGTCSFDLPQYHHWLLQPPEIRQTRFENWLADLKPALNAIRLVLSLVRTSAPPRRVAAEAGFFQEAIDPQAPAQMLRIGIESTHAIYPEVSGHKNRFSIRFMTIETKGKSAPCVEKILFKLTCCIF